MTPELTQALQYVKSGYSLRAALRAAGLPQTARNALTRALTSVGVPYARQGQGARPFHEREMALLVVGPPDGVPGYWGRLALNIAICGGGVITPEGAQLWYQRRKPAVSL